MTTIAPVLAFKLSSYSARSTSRGRVAEARLQANLPEVVRVSRVGEAQQLPLQGCGHAVTESIEELEKIDVR